MLKLDVNKEKQLTFEVQIGGVQSDKISSHLRIKIDEIEYGFPAKVGNESITVELPPLSRVVGRSLKEGEEVEVKLDIIADGNYLTPWTDSFRLSNPLVIEAKIMDSEFNKSPAFRTKLVQEGKSGDRKQGVRIEKELIEEEEDLTKDVKEEDFTEKIVNMLAEKLSSTFSNKKLVKEEDENKEDKAEEKEKKAEKVEAEADAEEEKEEKVEEKCVKESRRLKKIKTTDLLKITEKEVYEYMRRAGTKNEKIQKIIYEQAETMAQSSKPVDVLKQVVRILKDKR